MALAVTDPFNKLSPELRLQVLVSTRCKSSISRTIQASPIMLQQYLAHKKYIIRQVLAAEFDAEMIQDAMAIILLPSPRGSGREPLRKRQSQPMRAHLRAWANSQLPDPLKGNNDHLLSQLNKLHSQLLLLIEDYITKATASFPRREYLCLPQTQRSLSEGHLMFKGLKVTPRFNSASLTFPERKRFVKAFLVYELLSMVSNVPYVPDLRRRRISNAEHEAVGCVHNYVWSLYEAIFAQCNDVCLPPISTTPLGTGLFSPNIVNFDAETKARLKCLLGRDIKTGFSTLGYGRLTDFLRYDMAKPGEREALKVQLEHVWCFEDPINSFRWDMCLHGLFKWKRKYQNGCESSMYTQLSLNHKEKLRYMIGQQRAWVFFDDSRFYPQESTERPDCLSAKFFTEEPIENDAIEGWYSKMRWARFLR
ncbi:uncharacterized protein BKA55DRAFT_562891 [Fusarium redolens]|uniref:Uncharacterized protein n=1 Tax=Fusarium redolens TaxID=48865 RepID=A0A9P9HL88_FUSRE|nr:uncharacterized protein BKA55DRAFT_562891 [Fusarium redolens]KAH7259615.1 hypothetical protein BKA55DRAFT_562891 [Fusarium redolens]